MYFGGVVMIIGKFPFYQKWKSTGATFWKKRRFKKLLKLIPLPENRPVRILEVGCANGKDFIQFLQDDNRFQIWGVDIQHCHFEQDHIHFSQADAAALPFPDNSFDLVVSIGLLEHIEPMEKLCKAIYEFQRVGRHQLSVVPSISTIIEPHCLRPFFPFGLHAGMCSAQKDNPLHLNFFTEHTWTKFEGFYGCNIKRFYYLPPFIKNTVIYK